MDVLFFSALPLDSCSSPLQGEKERKNPTNQETVNRKWREEEEEEQRTKTNTNEKRNSYRIQGRQSLCSYDKKREDKEEAKEVTDMGACVMQGQGEEKIKRRKGGRRERKEVGEDHART